MRQPVGRGERKFERPRIGDARSPRDPTPAPLRAGQRLDLFGGAVNQDDADIQGPQQGDVEQQRRETLVADDARVDRENEGLLAKLGNVLQDAAQISELHGSGPSSTI